MMKKIDRTHDIYGHARLVAEDRCGPIDVCDVSEYPWSEPYPS
jgi:hypothetical protein